MKKSSYICIMKNRIRKYDFLKLVSFINNIKKKIEYLATLNPFILFFLYFICLFIPYLPNFPLYLICLNKNINKYVKFTCIGISIICAILQNVIIGYLILN